VHGLSATACCLRSSNRCRVVQVAVKVLSVQGANPAQLSRAEKEIQDNAHAARACPQVVRVLGHCVKDDQLCLVMLKYSGSLLTLNNTGNILVQY